MPDRTQYPVRPFSQANGTVEYHVYGIESWNDFESLVDFIVHNFSAEVINKLDGICSRTWTLRADDVDFIVKHHDDIGNFFYASVSSPEKKKLLQMIADALNNQLQT